MHATEPAAGSDWHLFDLVGSGVAVTAPDGTLEFCNTALSQLLARDSHALLGMSIFKLLEGSATMSWRDCTGRRSVRTMNCVRMSAAAMAVSSRARSCADWTVERVSA